MSKTVISVEHPCPEWNRRVSKAYRLGQIGTGMLRLAQRDVFINDLKLW
jgi:hypothetical protein